MSLWLTIWWYVFLSPHSKLDYRINFSPRFQFKYECDWHRLVNASQGDNAEEIAKAQQQVTEAKEAAEAAQAAAKAAQMAQIELEKALAEVKKQEEAYAAKTAELTKKSEEGGVVSRNKAKNELAQHLAEDPLPLRKAKITLEGIYFFNLTNKLTNKKTHSLFLFSCCQEGRQGHQGC